MNTTDVTQALKNALEEGTHFYDKYASTGTPDVTELFALASAQGMEYSESKEEEREALKTSHIRQWLKFELEALRRGKMFGDEFKTLRDVVPSYIKEFFEERGGFLGYASTILGALRHIIGETKFSELRDISQRAFGLSKEMLDFEKQLASLDPTGQAEALKDIEVRELFASSKSSKKEAVDRVDQALKETYLSLGLYAYFSGTEQETLDKSFVRLQLEFIRYDEYEMRERFQNPSYFEEKIEVVYDFDFPEWEDYGSGVRQKESNDRQYQKICYPDTDIVSPARLQEMLQHMEMQYKAVEGNFLARTDLLIKHIMMLQVIDIQLESRGRRLGQNSRKILEEHTPMHLLIYLYNSGYMPGDGVSLIVRLRDHLKKEDYMDLLLTLQNISAEKKNLFRIQNSLEEEFLKLPALLVQKDSQERILFQKLQNLSIETGIPLLPDGTEMNERNFRSLLYRIQVEFVLSDRFYGEKETHLRSLKNHIYFVQKPMTMNDDILFKKKGDAYIWENDPARIYAEVKKQHKKRAQGILGTFDIPQDEDKKGGTSRLLRFFGS
ncbi:MAG: hypothetical protein ACTSXQ_00340 [Alphaproteobacteria bacterium]